MVARQGSFTRAADSLGWPRPTVSLAIQQLESLLEVRLLHRTTRRVQLTSDGRVLVPRAEAMVEDADALVSLFKVRQEAVAGHLVIAAPGRIAGRLLTPALPALLQQYPRLDVVLSGSDHPIDLVAQGVDCALRFGHLSESSLVMVPLGKVDMVTCASPDYLRRRGRPCHPDELSSHHEAVGYHSRCQGGLISKGPNVLEFDLGERCVDVALPGRVTVDNAESYIAAAVAGLGLIQVPRFDVQDALGAGSLEVVMASHGVPGLPVAVVYPHRRHRHSRLGVAIDWLQKVMAQNLRP